MYVCKVVYNTGKSALPNIKHYTHDTRGQVRSYAYQAKHECLCYNCRIAGNFLSWTYMKIKVVQIKNDALCN